MAGNEVGAPVGAPTNTPLTEVVDIAAADDAALHAMLPEPTGPNAVALVMNSLAAYVPNKGVFLLVTDEPAADGGPSQMHHGSNLSPHQLVRIFEEYLIEFRGMVARSPSGAALTTDAPAAEAKP